jgi:REP element-mobilizing transposase RayT
MNLQLYQYRERSRFSHPIELTVFSQTGDTLCPGMPHGLTRYQSSKQSHFVTFSCYRRLPHLQDERLRDLFIECLERTRRNYLFRVYGYVVMPEHVHLLVSEPEAELLAKAIQAIKISVTRRAKTDRDERNLTLWQKRYYPQREERRELRGEIALHSSQPGQAWTGRITGRLEVEQSPALPYVRNWAGRDRVAMGRGPTGGKNPECVANSRVNRSQKTSHLPNGGRCGAPSATGEEMWATSQEMNAYIRFQSLARFLIQIGVPTNPKALRI